MFGLNKCINTCRVIFYNFINSAKNIIKYISNNIIYSQMMGFPCIKFI